MQEVRLILGPPASGKSELSNQYISQGYIHINRDKVGCPKVIDLLPSFRDALAAGKSVVLDNLFPDRELRACFIEVANKAGVPIHAHLMGTSIEDSSINALHRMWARYGRVFMTAEEIAEHPKAKQDPNTFPIVVLFNYKNKFEKPTASEGFSSITSVKFVRRALPSDYDNAAIIFDYDGTLRTSDGGEYDFPTRVEEVKLLPGRKEKMQELLASGVKLLGVSNQSGIARKQVTSQNAIACFEQTNRLLGAQIEFHFCPHNVPPKCYCRKPQSGLGVLLIHQHKLNPKKCVYVGDQTTDKTFAERLGMEYRSAEEFFK